MKLRPFAALSLLIVLIAPVSLAQSTPPTDALPPPAPRLGIPSEPWGLPQLPAGARDDLPPAREGAPAAPDYDVPFAPYTRLVYQSARNNHDWDIYGADGNGNNQVNLSNHPSNDVAPRLDRGGNRIVFASDRYGDFDIFAVPVTGAEFPPRLTDAPGSDIYPAWSPDGARIAFQSQRDGQPEIYVMNANGSGQTRLTNYPGLDGQPDWSPDGTRIAFIRQVGNTTHLWVMHADGSSPHEIAALPFCENAAWSPDGQSIGFDADENGDGWMELWTVGADGGQPDMLYRPGRAATDAWMGGWSPDSHYIIYTTVRYVQYQGQWYWLDGVLSVLDTAGRFTAYTYPGSGADWSPSVQSIDLLPPTTTVLPLPPVSPSNFRVDFTAADVGPSGLRRVEVQISIDNGPWTDWRNEVSGGWTRYDGGRAGQTIAFRARGTDWAGNVEPWPAQPDARTRIESEPPLATFQPLPGYTQGRTVEVFWSMIDPGGSGVTETVFEVQDTGTGEWRREGALETGATFTGEMGHTYRFRVRGVDAAGNQGEWPAEERLPRTTLYEWKVAGAVMDNGGAHVTGAQITLSSPLLGPAASDAAGQYAAYTAANPYSHEFGISKAGYGELPPTQLFTAQEGEHIVVLPPADNILADGGFENGLGQWVAGGAVKPVVSGGDAHSGVNAARLFPAMPAQGLPMQLTNSPNREEWIALTAVPDGGAHMLWREFGGPVIYGFSRANRTWGVPPAPAPQLNMVNWGSMAVTPDGTVWLAGDGYKYGDYPGAVLVSRKPGGVWSTPQLVPPSDVFLRGSPILKPRPDGSLVIVSREDQTVHIAERSAAGAWSSGVNVGGEDWIERGPGVALGPGNEVHVVWQDSQGSVHYACKSSEGAIHKDRPLIPGSHFQGAPQIAVSPAGEVSIVSSEPMQYVTGRCGHAFSAPVTLGRGLLYSLVVDKDGTVSVLGHARMDARLIYYRKPVGGAWQAPEVLASMLAPTSAMMSVDDAGIVYVAWAGWSGEITSQQVMYYARRGALPHWERAQMLAPRTPDHLLFQGEGPTPFIVEGSGRLHATWTEWDTVTSAYDVFYSRLDPGIADADAGTLTREFVVPAADTHPGLSFVYRFSGSPDPARPSFAVTLKHAGGMATLVTRTAESLGWRHEWADLTPYAGQTIQLTFTVDQWGGLTPAWAILDDVTVGSTKGDAWVAAASPLAAAAGSEYVITVAYGNRGAVAAEGAQVTLQLPPSVTFVSAEPAPLSTAGELRWAAGALPARSTAGTIKVRVAVAPGTANGTALDASAGITVSTPELEKENNSAGATTTVGHRVYGPLLAR